MKRILILSSVCLALSIWIWSTRNEPESPEAQEPARQFAGSTACISCHAAEYNDWMGSHHERSMLPATPANIRAAFDGRRYEHDGIKSRFFIRDGRYFVHTQGADGQNADFEVAYTFGWYPLQQYLVEFPDGRIQTLRTAWDARPAAEGGQKWFHLYPDEHIPPGDELHWTGPQQNWNFMCAECHSTGFRKNYDTHSDTFDSSWAEVNVACEACHGPAQGHLTWAEKPDDSPHRGFEFGLVSGPVKWEWDPKTRKPVCKTKTTTTETETCARCHSRRSQLWEDVRHGDLLAQTHRVAILTDDLYFPDGQIKDEVFVYGSFLQSRMHMAGVRCTDCHLPHKRGLRFEGNLLCVRCHGDADYETVDHMHHEPGTPGGQCVDCHMPERTYMVVDPRRDHRFGSPRPDVSKKTGSPNACSTCHQDKDLDWVNKQFTTWYGSTRKSQDDHGELFALGRAADPRALTGLLAMVGRTDLPAITRATALELLSRIPTRESAEAHIQAGSDATALMRLQALRGLDQLEPSHQIRTVGPLLQDKVRLVRMEAARILAALPRQDLPEKLRNNFDRAIQEYVDSQHTNADRDFSHYNLGLLYAQLGKISESQAAYRQALRLNPASVRTWVNLADTWRQSGNEKRLQAILDEAEEATGPQAIFAHVRGLSLIREKRNGEAVQAFRRATDLEGDNPERCATLVAALLAINARKEAYAAYDDFLARNGQHAGILQSALQLHLSHGNKERALGYARRLLALFPEEARLQQLVESLR